jgi:hypothetical protein
LNENTVNIDNMPLEASDDGMEEGDGEEGDGENEVEYIEEGVFDATQPTKRKRTFSYNEVEDACLVRASKGVSPHAVMCNDQNGKR